MKKYKFEELVPGKIYSDDCGFWQFVEMRNEYLATFLEMHYDDETFALTPTSNYVYLTKFETKFY